MHGSLFPEAPLTEHGVSRSLVCFLVWTAFVSFLDDGQNLHLSALNLINKAESRTSYFDLVSALSPPEPTGLYTWLLKSFGQLFREALPE